MNNPALDPQSNPAIEPPKPQILDIADPPQEPHPVFALAYGGGENTTSDSVFRLERGTPRYRYGRLTPLLPQFKAQKLYTRNSNTVPTNVPITQSSPATSPFVNTTTGRVGFPTGTRTNLTAPDLP